MEDSRLKQRIVGAVVLVSLAVIFIPMILTGSKTATTEIAETNIPEKPDREFVSRIIPLDRQAPEPAPVSPSRSPEPEPKVGEIPPPPAAESSPAIEPIPSTEPAAARPEPAPLPTVAKTVSAWVVQAGVFGSKDNAYALRDKLRKLGFDAFVDTQHDNDTTTYRVRVGPEVKRESAEATQAKLQKAASVKGFVTTYP